MTPKKRALTSFKLRPNEFSIIFRNTATQTKCIHGDNAGLRTININNLFNNKGI